MALYVRKISRAKWPEDVSEFNNIAELKSDALADLRTQNNTLSFWKIESESDLESAILALSASSSTSKIENVTIIWTEEETLKSKGFIIDESVPGDTVVQDLKNTHRDLCELTYASLGTVAEIIIQSLKSDKFKRYSKNKVRQLLVQAYENNRVSETSLIVEELKK